jgi:hypothetical protein
MPIDDCRVTGLLHCARITQFLSLQTARSNAVLRGSRISIKWLHVSFTDFLEMFLWEFLMFVEN